MSRNRFSPNTQDPKPSTVFPTRHLSPVTCYLLLILALLLLAALPLFAQNTELPVGFVQGFIQYGETVQETIAADAIFDTWAFNGRAGDVIRVVMTGSDGLAPLTGIQSDIGDIAERSPEGEPNSTVEFTYTLPSTREFILVASRAGTDTGTTVGSYRLTLQWLNAPTPTPANGEVTFVCEDGGVAGEVTALATLQWQPSEAELNAEVVPNYRIGIYGLDGLVPMLWIARAGVEAGDCSQADSATSSPVTQSSLVLPGGETVNADAITGVFETTVGGIAPGETVTITAGAVGGTRGRYLLVVGEFGLEPPDEGDLFRVRNAPLAAASPLDVYMLAVGENTRLDPALALLGETGDSRLCDDAGRRPCDDLIGATGMRLNLGETAVAGNRFSAGLRLAAGELGWQDVQTRSFRGNTRGRYVLVLIGQL